MINKATELNAAKERLAELINKLQVVEGVYDKAIEHDANYLGNDKDIEHARDERSKDFFKEVLSVKEEIKRQIQLVQTQVANY